MIARYGRAAQRQRQAAPARVQGLEVAAIVAFCADPAGETLGDFRLMSEAQVALTPGRVTSISP